MTIGKTVRKAIKEISDGILSMIGPKDFKLDDGAITNGFTPTISLVGLSTSSDSSVSLKSLGLIKSKKPLLTSFIAFLIVSPIVILFLL